MTKTCCVCAETKSVVNFYKRAESKDGMRSECKTCMSAYKRKYYANNREDQCSKRRAYDAANPEKTKQKERKNKYGHCTNFTSTMIRYDSVTKCECCNKVFGDIRGDNMKCIDHSANYIRGLICASCNMGIGQLGDNIKGIKHALNYLTNKDKYAIMEETKGESK